MVITDIVATTEAGASQPENISSLELSARLGTVVAEHGSRMEYKTGMRYTLHGSLDGNGITLSLFVGVPGMTPEGASVDTDALYEGLVSGQQGMIPIFGARAMGIGFPERGQSLTTRVRENPNNGGFWEISYELNDHGRVIDWGKADPSNQSQGLHFGLRSFPDYNSLKLYLIDAIESGEFKPLNLPDKYF